MNLAIIIPFLFGIAAFLICVVVKRYMPKRLNNNRRSLAAASIPQRAEAIQSIRASLEDLYRQLDAPPVAAVAPHKKSAIGILYRCGISSYDIAEQLRLSRGEVDLTVPSGCVIGV